MVPLLFFCATPSLNCWAHGNREAMNTILHQIAWLKFWVRWTRSIFLSHGVSINFFFQITLFLFFLRPFYLSTWFLCLLRFESVTFNCLSEFLFLVLFWMLWMSVTVNKLKHMTCHGSQASQIGNNETCITNETSPVLVTGVLSNNIWKYR